MQDGWNAEQAVFAQSQSAWQAFSAWREDQLHAQAISVDIAVASESGNTPSEDDDMRRQTVRVSHTYKSSLSEQFDLAELAMAPATTEWGQQKEVSSHAKRAV